MVYMPNKLLTDFKVNSNFNIIFISSLHDLQGPLKGFLEALGKLQKKFYAKGHRLDCPIRTYLVTARSAASSGIRALKTLRAWGLETDEALFLAGAPKGPMLEKIRPHIYFDDQMFHIEGAAEMGTIAAHVPYGIAQKYPHKKTANSDKQGWEWTLDIVLSFLHDSMTQ